MYVFYLRRSQEVNMTDTTAAAGETEITVRVMHQSPENLLEAVTRTES